jgi:hypothetical protein
MAILPVTAGGVMAMMTLMMMVTVMIRMPMLQPMASTSAGNPTPAPLTTHDKYKGHDRVHTADGNGMKINHIGHSILHTPNHSLHLKNILHVPSASKNLLYVHKLTLDNHVFIEYHLFSF